MPRLGSSCESGLQSLSARLVGLRLEGLWAISGSWIGAGNKSGEQCKREGPESGPQLAVQVALPWAGALRMQSGGSSHVSM